MLQNLRRHTFNEQASAKLLCHIRLLLWDVGRLAAFVIDLAQGPMTAAAPKPFPD